MSKLVFNIFGFSCLIAAGCIPLPANAQMIISGNGAPYDCYMKTKTGDPGRKKTIKACIAALEDPDLSRKNQVALKTNIGILHMRAGHYEKARIWYDDALKMDPDNDLIHVNYSACEVFMGHYEKAIILATQALELGTQKEPEALYNRAIAYDRLDKFTPAYRDLEKALELRPNWPPAIKAISNYEVISAPKG